MINLAGHKDPDPIAEEELFVAGIEVEHDRGGVVRASGILFDE